MEGGGALHTTEAVFLLSHPTAPGLILGIPENLFWCCWDLSTALVRGKWTVAWEWWLYPSRTGYWQARTAKKITFKNCVPWHLRSTFPRSTLIYFLQVLSESEKSPKSEKGGVRKKTGRQEKFCFCVSKTCFKWFRCLRCKTHARRRQRFRTLNKSVDDVAVVVVVVDVVPYVAVVVAFVVDVIVVVVVLLLLLLLLLLFFLLLP